MEAPRRTAFQAGLALDRRQQAGQAVPAITAVALDHTGRRLFLGLEDGWLEEHALLPTGAGVGASLAARKHAAKRAITAIHHVAAPAAAGGGSGGALVVLSEDGSAQLLDGDSLAGRTLPLRHVVAACVGLPPGRPPRLAVALKPSKKALRFMIYELLFPSGGSGSQQPPQAQLLAQAEVPDGATAVHGMGWVGPQLAVCAGMRYLLVAPLAGGGGGASWRELFSVPDELAYCPAMLATLPDLARALLVVGPAGIVVDAGGNPVGSALRLEALGAPPRALAASAPFLLVASEAGMHVFDRDNGAEVQRLGFGPGLHPLPGQPLHAAAAPDGPAGAAGSGCVAVAGRRLVWLCSPVSPADQARELLAQGDYTAALDLIQGGLHQGAAWAQVAAAQAALLLLHECRFEEALRCLDAVSPSTFQPAQLFPLFPSYTAPWAQQVPTHQRYWGLHAPLPSLEALIDRKLRGRGPLRQQQPSRAGSSGLPSPSAGTPAAKLGSSHSSGLFALEGGGSSAGADSPAPTASPPPGQQQHPGEGAAAAGERRESQNLALEPSAAAEALAQQQQQPGGRQRQQQPSERQQLQRQAWEALAQYLFRVRMLEGVACLPGVDSLLLLLLADLGEPRQVAAYCAVPNQADVATVEPRLQAEQWHHALATLHAARGAAATALSIWRRLADGQLAAPADPEVQAAERAEALESAAALLRDPAACPEATLVDFIPWLLGASQPAALGVLTARHLAPAAVLPLLPPDSDVRWQYLSHLVEGGTPGADPALHTELAAQLAAAILRAEPALRSPEPVAGGGRRSSAGGGGAGRLARSSSAGGRRRHSRTSTAALVSGGSLEPGPGASRVDAMRLRLRAHLEASPLYDEGAALAALQGTGLHEELVVLHSRAGHHMGALRVLALTLRDVAAAEAYARAHLEPPQFRALLQLVLEPGPGLEPRWDDACYLLAALGDHLDPGEVLAALPPAMPLAAAAGVLAPMLRDRTHRRRQALVAKNLQRARLAAAGGVLADAQAQRVAVDEERACPHCHLRLGGKVFVVLPPGVAPGAAAAGVQAKQQQGQQQQGQQQAEDDPGALRPPGDDGLAAAAARLQAAAEAGQAPQVLCYACYRRLAGVAAGPEELVPPPASAV